MWNAADGALKATTKNKCESQTGISDKTICDFKLCNFAVLGTVYQVENGPSSPYAIESGRTTTLNFPDLTPMSGWEYGNSIATHIEQQSGKEISWASIASYVQD